MVERASWRRVLLQAIALIVLLVTAFTWWRWSNSIDLKLTTDFPYSYCVDVVSGEVVPVSPNGDVRLRVARRDRTAMIDVVTPEGSYRARIPCYEGYFWFVQPIPYPAETITGRGTWSLGSFNELFLEAAVPGACAVVSSERITASRITASRHRSGIHWVSCDRGEAEVLGSTLTLEGSEGWTLLLSRNGFEESRVWAAAEKLESLFVIDPEGHVQHSVREGDTLQVTAPRRGSWSTHARNVDGDDLSIWVDGADSRSGMDCDFRLTPP